MGDNVSIVCIGQLVADIVVRPVDGLPIPGRTDPVEELHLLSGGCAANTAAVLAKLGADVRLAAVIGQDTLGDAVLADLQSVGVGLDTVVREAEAPTSAAIVLVAGTGERSFFYRTGGNERLANRHLTDAALKAARDRACRRRDETAESRSGRVDGPGKIVRLHHLARHRLGHQRPVDAKASGALPRIDYLMTNEEEAAMLTGKDDPREAAEDLLARGTEGRGGQAGRAGRDCWPRKME